MDTLEKKVADCILQQATDKIEIDGHEFELTSPTPATLIMLSGYISEMPDIDITNNNVLAEVLATAKDLSVLGKICAVLILGAKRIKERREILITETLREIKWSWRKFRKVEKFKHNTIKVLELDWLAERLLNDVTNRTLTSVVAKRLGMMQIPDFFGLTTSLCEANQLKRTREVETASGAKS